MRNLEISDEGIEAIRGLLSLGDKGLSDFKCAAEKTGPTLRTPGERSVLLAAASEDLKAQDLERVLVNSVVPLFMWQEAQELSPLEFHTHVAQSLASQTESNCDDVKTKWDELKDALVTFFDSNAIQTEAKAIALLRQQLNALNSVKIITDSRPIFNSTRESISASLILTTLRIVYRDGEETRTAQFTLDLDDLDSLEVQIKRARKKHEKIAEVNNTSKIPTLLMRPSSTTSLNSDQEQ